MNRIVIASLTFFVVIVLRLAVERKLTRWRADRGEARRIRRIWELASKPDIQHAKQMKSLRFGGGLWPAHKREAQECGRTTTPAER